MFDDPDDDLNDASLSEYGERARGREILFRRAGADDHPMDGIFDEAFTSIRVEDNAEISDVSPSLLIRSTDLPAGTDLLQGDRFVVRGASYRAWDLRPDGGGMVRILLKDARP